MVSPICINQINLRSIRTAVHRLMAALRLAGASFCVKEAPWGHLNWAPDELPPRNPPPPPPPLPSPMSAATGSLAQSKNHCHCTLSEQILDTHCCRTWRITIALLCRTLTHTHTGTGRGRLAGKKKSNSYGTPGNFVFCFYANSFISLSFRKIFGCVIKRRRRARRDFCNNNFSL